MNTTALTPELEESLTLIEKRQYPEAIMLMRGAVNSSANPEYNAMLGLAYFHNENYQEAIEQYQIALKSDPSNLQWSAMLDKCRENALAEVNVPVPEVYHFDREKLIGASVIKKGDLPSDKLPPEVMSRKLGKMRLYLGNQAGQASSAILSFVTRLWGKVVGTSGKVWTNWYRRPLLLGILTLSYMRENLNKKNLVSTYPKDSLIGFQPKGMEPPEGVKYYRTADGSWNDLKNPKEGAAGTRLFRNVSLKCIKLEDSNQLITPNPRLISRKLLTRGEKMKEIPFLNMLAAAWIQFQNADWINHGENYLKEVIEIPLEDNDPARKKFLQSKMLIPKTQPDPTRMNGIEQAPVSFINEVTHWWDGSQIYGSDQETQDKLRSGLNGKLKVNDDNTLPLDNKGIEMTGFTRNWWVGMTMLHTLFTLEHNAICDELRMHYPTWDDNRLFNVARLINAAVMAKIHSVEWTPAILPNQGLDMALNANWYGVLTNLFKKPTYKRTVSQINVANPELGGVVGNPINKHNVCYGFAEEFVEVYRLHSLLPEMLQLRRYKNGEPIKDISFSKTRQAGAAKLTRQVPLADLFYSFGNQHPGQLVLNNYPKFMQELSIPLNPVFDMGAVDILRARERGVPRYNEFRRQLGLKPISNFDDLTDDKNVVEQLKEIYGSTPQSVENLDLMIGTLAEGHRPSGFGFGETMFQIFILNATRRLQADRFYTDCFTDEYYTKEGMAWIDQADLKTVILRHYPELASTGLGNVKNAFEPWDTEKNLDPGRHPLRKWDKRLKNGPWVGDAY